MELQKFLRENGPSKFGTDLLKFKYGIKSNRHPRFPNLVQFKYDQIDSPMGERIVQESRGVILDEANNWHVVARPFDKFFNWGEGHTKEINWATARVLEKLDGSLMILYHHMDEWHVASSGMVDAGGQVNGFPITFRDLFWKTFNEMGLKTPDPQFWEGGAFMFELTSPYNRVVVSHEKPLLTLIGVRDYDGQEYPVSSFAHQYPVVRSFPLNEPSALLTSFQTMDPVKQEGYVVVDGNFNRVKVKHPGYVAIHHMKDGFGIKRMVALVQSNEGSEFMAHFPEWANVYNEVKLKFDGLVAELEVAYALISHIENQKDFALLATKTRNPGSLFALRKGMVQSVRESLAQTQTEKLMDLLDVSKLELVSAV